MTQSNSKVSRRGFLIAVTGSAIAAAAGCRPAGLIPPTVYAPGSAPHATFTPPPTIVADAAIHDPTWGEVTFDKIFFTPVDKLYITQYDYNNTPDINPNSWSMTVNGLVTTPLTLTYPDLKNYPVYEDIRTLECISNPPGGTLIGNLQIKGFRFSEILKQVGVKPEATAAKFTAQDGYVTSVKMEWLLQDDVMMALEMNGAPLNARHGFPIRILIPGLYGQKMPRWITGIEFINYEFHGYWEGNGWSDKAEIQTTSVIKGPADGGGVKAGSILAIQGLAFAGKRKITKVEVQINKGDWMPAQLTYGPSPLAWTQWYLTWSIPAAGTYRLGVRATDDTGFVQNQEAEGSFGNAFPNGTSAIGRITILASAS